MAVTRGRPIDRRGVDPSRRRGNPAGGASDAGRILSVAADRDRAAASAIAARRSPRMIAASGLHADVALARGIADRGHRHLCRRHHGRTRIVLPAGADRVHGRLAGRAWRTESDRGGQARRVDRAWPARLQFHRRLSRRSIDAGGATAGRHAGSAGASSSASCWPIRRRATASVDAADPRGRTARRRARAHARGARTLSAAIAASRWERPMREPAFWHRPPSLDCRDLLMPLGALYGAVTGRRMQRQGFEAGIPVLCVGNYHLGGAGKTPTVLALAKLLRDLGETPVVLSRGYGGRLRGPVRVDPQRHAAADVGDEPLMLARTRAGGGRARPRRRRRAGALAGRQRDPDGRRLSESGGRQGCLADRDRRRARPRQWLRVSRRPAARAAAAATRAHRCADRDRRRRGGRARRGRDRGAGQAGAVGASEAGRRLGRSACAASACWPLPGSAIPARFFATLRASGIDVVGSAPFADHHPYPPDEIESLIARRSATA